MRCLLTALAASLAAGLSGGQGAADGFVNFESPPVKPITIARVAGHDYVLVCNTPDNAVEIYDTITERLSARVRVGLEPVSVVWNAVLSRFYTANMVGDSVSVVRLRAASATARLEVLLERTEWVGDEPMMVGFLPGELTLLVTHNQMSAVSWRHSLTLAPVVPGLTTRIDLVDDFGRPTEALQDPRAILRHGDRLFVLGYRGGHSFFHDFDLWAFDLRTLTISKLGELGTLKTNMAFAANGDLYVVGGEAQNQRRGIKDVAAAETGFVTSLLHRVTGAGTRSAKIRTRDLNTDASGKPVARERSLAHPQDVALLERGGQVEKVFVAAFHSDRVGVVVAKDPDPKKWAIRAIDVPVAAGSWTGMAGPRGLALKRAIPGLPGDPGDRLYVLNRVDSSLAILDPHAERVLAVRPLAHDPTPPHIRRGRRFLYSAKLSGHGFVACASCHLDGRSDGLAWDLGESPGSKTPPIPRELVDGVTDDRIRDMRVFPPAKGPMVTQSLQGLVNWETVDPSQFLFTNAPYHWRGDTDFLSFNGAFVKLQGMNDLGGGGLPAADMRRYEVFVNSISYPPNPEQPLDRTYSGTLGDPNKTDGSGGLRGMKLFHTERIVTDNGQPTGVTAGRSCVQCHFLPDGSNNEITRMGVSTPQPVETAGLRFLLQKEAVIEKDASGVGTVRTGEFGTEHQGTLRSINDFTLFVFGHEFQNDKKPRLDAITQFLREFDTGVAPLVGFPLTVDRAAAGRAMTRLAFDFFERQARAANAGVAVQARIAGKERGFWFAPERGLYQEEPGDRSLDRSSLLALAQRGDDLLVVQGTPLGNERRIASPSGKPEVRRGPAPSEIRLEAMVPNTAWEKVPSLTKNWVPGPLADPLAFVWTGVFSGTQVPVPEPPSLRALRLLQYGLVQDAGELRGLRHEAPRRFRVSGREIRPGATLVLYVPNDPTTPPPYDKGFRPMIPIQLPVYATGDKTITGAPIFATAVEADAQLTYVLSLGGPAAPGIKDAFDGRLEEPPAKGTFDPGRWNKHWVWVVNEDGTYGTGGWQAIRLQ